MDAAARGRRCARGGAAWPSTLHAYSTVWYILNMRNFPVRWVLAPQSRLYGIASDIEAHLHEWGAGPREGTPVVVWDGTETLAAAGPAAGSLTAQRDELYALVLVGPGPFGLIPQEVAAHFPKPTARELWAAIMALSNGLIVTSGRKTVRSDDGGSGEPADPAEERTGITRREQEVLECIARGLPNKAIAAELEISLGTVKFHLSNLMEKLAVQNRAELVMEATREGLLAI